jgi:phosphoglycolate phosphatase-like HAD superfamily hydrolase
VYDSLPRIFEVYMEVCRRIGYPPVTQERYRTCFQSKDWRKLCSDLGIAQEHAQTVIDMFVEDFAKAEPPQLIPGAKDTIFRMERTLGHGNLYILTNEPIQNVKRRFERDGLEEYLCAVRTPFEGKAKELYELSRQKPDEMLIYVGDLVSDGEACVEAGGLGSDNIAFFAITHEYAMNTPQALRDFVRRNPGIAAEVGSLEELADLF